MKIIHNEMEYSILHVGEVWDIWDVAGSRPLGLRDAGPWTTEEAAIEAVRNMTIEESRL